MDYDLMFLKGLALTIFIETVVLIGYFRLITKRKDINYSRMLMTGFIASFATLPYLWYFFPSFIFHKMAYIVIGESFAVLVETGIIAAILRTKLSTSFFCSLTCNLISFFTGLLLMG